MAKNSEQEKQRIREHNEKHFAKHPKLNFDAIKAALVEVGFETVEICDDLEDTILIEDNSGCSCNVILDWDDVHHRYTGDLALEVQDWPGRDDDADEDILPQVTDTIGLDHNACETPGELADYIADWRDALKADPELYNSY